MELGEWRKDDRNGLVTVRTARELLKTKGLVAPYATIGTNLFVG